MIRGCRQSRHRATAMPTLPFRSLLLVVLVGEAFLPSASSRLVHTHTHTYTRTHIYIHCRTRLRARPRAYLSQVACMVVPMSTIHRCIVASKYTRPCVTVHTRHVGRPILAIRRRKGRDHAMKD
ncbi:hypothetical protein EV127DRAFT_425425 [Xylaria flabelliformis]|nr:hypothetical protein EV127DRAFT_425425 [Xylaria flabelliformis]